MNPWSFDERVVTGEKPLKSQKLSRKSRHVFHPRGPIQKIRWCEKCGLKVLKECGKSPKYKLLGQRGFKSLPVSPSCI